MKTIFILCIFALVFIASLRCRGFNPRCWPQRMGYDMIPTNNEVAESNRNLAFEKKFVGGKEEKAVYGLENQTKKAEHTY